MRKINLLILTLFVSAIAFSQQNTKFNESRRGFIGLSVGPAIPVGDWSDLGAGATLSIADFGYLFHPNVGIAAKWFGSGHTVNDHSLGVGGMMFGVLSSAPMSPKINFEAKGLVGFGLFTNSYESTIESSDTYLGYDLGVGLRFNTSKKISLLTNIDYMGIYDYNSVNITFGVAYRLR